MRGISGKSTRRAAGICIFLLAAAAVIAAGREFLSLSALQIFTDRIDRMGSWGLILFTAVYVIACVLAMPASILTLAAGFLFGIWKGYAVVAVGSVAGASAAFWIGRTAGREWVRRKAERHPKFSAVDGAVTRSGFKIVMLTRLSPIFPFNLQNFAYGATGVAFRDYAWATWIGMIPGTVMFVYLGSAMKNIAEIFSGNVQGGAALKLVGLAATVAVTVLVTREASRALKRSIGE